MYCCSFFQFGVPLGDDLAHEGVEVVFGRYPADDSATHVATR